MNTSPDSNSSIRPSITTDKLAAMRFVAQMREVADRVGAGFIGGFIAPDGECFCTSNLDAEAEQEFLKSKLNPSD